MSQFNYTLPSGAQFVVNGPPGATQAEADRIFYEQVAAGSLIGYTAGQTLTSPATQLTKFELSRLDRGTAGVDTTTILAIVQGLPVVAGIPDLSNVALTSPINEADIVLAKGDDLGPGTVGPLTSYQVQKLLAQTASLVDQEFDQISQNKGIGRYGFTAYALEEAGYVKPGTSLRFFAVDPEDFISVMSSPSVWTGKDGVYSLSDLLGSVETQNNIQTQLMQQGYKTLTEAGIITDVKKPPVSISTGQIFTNSGLQSVAALTTLSLLGTNLGSLSGVARNALLSSSSLNRLLSGSAINLSTIGSGAVNSLLSSAGGLNFASIGAGLTNQISGSIGALVTNASKFGADATALWAKSGGLTGIANLASGGLSNLSGTLSNLTSGGLTNLAGSLTNNLNGITSNLTNLIPGSLSNLTSSLDIFGKAGSFATNFANPLGNLNNLGNLSNLGNLGSLIPGGGIGGALTGQLGGLTGALSGQLGGLTGALSGQLGGITGALSGQLGSLTGALSGQLGSLTGALSGQLGSLTGVLGNLGGLANIGAVGDLFGGGGDLVSGTAVAGGFNNTVNRATVDAAFSRIVGSRKVPTPIYTYPSLPSLASRLDIFQAQNILQGLQRQAGSTFGQTVTI